MENNKNPKTDKAKDPKNPKDPKYVFLLGTPENTTSSTILWFLFIIFLSVMGIMYLSLLVAMLMPSINFWIPFSGSFLILLILMCNDPLVNLKRDNDLKTAIDKNNKDDVDENWKQ